MEEVRNRMCVVDVLYRYVDSMDGTQWTRNGIELSGSRRLRRDLVSEYGKQNDHRF